jgi:hypothetical protein
MKWTESDINGIMRDLAEENTLACFTLMSIAKTVFTNEVATLAVSLGEHPILYINREFLNRHAEDEDDVKTLLFHEYLHLILGHHLQFKVSNPLLNIAMDAIINALLVRLFGDRSSKFLVKFYRVYGIDCLLRPLESNFNYKRKNKGVEFGYAYLNKKIYSGKITVEECYQILLSDLMVFDKDFDLGKEDYVLIGNHQWDYGCDSSMIEDCKEKIDPELIKKFLGKGGETAEISFNIRPFHDENWERIAIHIFKKILLPGTHQRRNKMSEALLPIWNSRDRRSFSALGTNPLILLQKNIATNKERGEKVRVYLDVSGSMVTEIDQLVNLMGRFIDHIEMPILAFSDQIKPAMFKGRRLQMHFGGGTNIKAVFDHIEETRCRKCLIITDGIVGQVKNYPSKIHVIISPMGDTSCFTNRNFSVHQLPPSKI